MTFSLCIIGNSHVAAVKQAWTNRAPKVRNGVTVTFFSAQNYMMSHIKLEGRALVPHRQDLAEKLRFTSDGKERVEIDDYDAFVVVASGFGIDLPKIRAQCGTVDHQRFSRVENMVSTACFDFVTEAAFEASRAIELIDMIRRVSQVPIILIAAPFMSDRLLADDVNRDLLHMKDTAPLEPLVAKLKATAERIAAKRASEVVWQHDSTIALPGFTRQEFNRGAVRFNMRDGKQPEFDDKHGNEDFGYLSLMAALNRLHELSGGRVLPGAKQRSQKRAATKTA